MTDEQMQTSNTLIIKEMSVLGDKILYIKVEGIKKVLRFEEPNLEKLAHFLLRTIYQPELVLSKKKYEELIK